MSVQPFDCTAQTNGVYGRLRELMLGWQVKYSCCTSVVSPTRSVSTHLRESLCVLASSRMIKESTEGTTESASFGGIPVMT